MKTLRKTATLAIVCCLFFSHFNSQAQFTVKRTPNGYQIGYLEYLPPDYNSTTEDYPLLIFLHGLGERGDGSPAQIEKVKAWGPPKKIKEGHDMCFMVDGQQECFIVIAPQLPTSNGLWGAPITHHVVQHILNGPDNYRIDPSRIYLTGLSLGGMGTWAYTIDSRNDPNIFAAISPIAAKGNPANGCTIAAKNPAIWAFHGDNDGTIPYNAGLNMFNGVANCTTPAPTSELIFTTYTGVGHNSWSRAYRTDNSLHTPNLYEWLLSKSLGGTPTADAGADVSITLPTNSVILNGSGTDPDGTITGYSWVKLTGPAATLSNASTPNLTVSNMVEGTYTFQLTVTDDAGNTATDVVTVTVNPLAVNQAPTGNAGPDITITLPVNSTNLVGSASDPDGTIASYQWTKQSGPAASLSGATSSTLTASNLVEGTYVFRLTVTDNDGATAFDEATVTVNPAVVNQLPTANAGPDFDITLPVNSTNIAGSGSDPDGSISTYAWIKVSGPTATLTNANQPTLLASNLVEGTYVFRLTVTDNSGDSDSDDMTLNVIAINQTPTANAGPDRNITLPTSTVVLSGSGNDSDGSITSYSWTSVSGPSSPTLTNQTTPTLTASALAEGSYVFRLEVTDNDGASATDDVTVVVNAAPVNEPPVANAGPDRNITLPTNSLTLNGSGTDPDGTIASYQWIKVSGPAAVLNDETTANLALSSLVAGTYVFRLTVTDNSGDSDSDEATVTVAPEVVNQTPTADAGVDRFITLPTNSATLNGSANDPDGTIATYLWSQISGPSSATLAGVATADLTASNLVEGTYTFELTVTDNDGATASDVAQITVNAANQIPTANAGPDQTLTLPTNSLTLNGSAIDLDGTITTYLWTQRSGSPATLNNQNTENVTISNLAEGTYVFRLTVIDNDGASDFDEVVVTVFQNTPNELPTANAGPDQTVTLPTTTLVLNGSGNDTDGTITAYAWTKISGPSVVLTNSTNDDVTLENLVQGVYVFRLTVTDNDGATAFDDVQVTVNPAAVNNPPVADAGPNVSITLPVNSTNLVGSGTDVDGSIASYMWSKVSGPSVTITNGNNSTVTLTNLVEGSYTFMLTVTDDDGDSDTDQVNVTVQPAIVNQSPVANAGANITLTLPTNSTNVIGSGSDPDGSIATYSWNKLSGPAATETGTSMSTLTLTNLVEGVYVYRLTVTDDDGATDNDDVTITVNAAATNQDPIADAGSDISITLPTNAVNIAGSGTDNDGTVTTYDWFKVSGPTATLTNADQPTLQVTNMVEGTYVFRLTITDDDGATDSDDVQVIVLPAAVNSIPTANAGFDIQLILPTNSTNVNGSGTDSDGSIIGHLWEKISGPAATLTDIDQATLVLTDLVEGNYIFRLTVTDNEGATAFDEMMVEVLPATANVPPVANAGNNQTLNLPTNTIVLNGTGTDVDGTVDTYFWEKISGPALTLVNETTPDVTLQNLLEGVYTMRLTVTDNDGDSDSDDVVVNVLPASVNQSPSANAGLDVSLLLPTNSATLMGSGTDPDGTITTYAWTKQSGPADGVLANDDTPNLDLSQLVEGVYVFRLTVTDDGGLTAFDDATVTVDDPGTGSTPNDPPQVDAGEDVTLILPDNSVTLNGSYTDDGLAEDYLWTKVQGSDDAILSDPTLLDLDVSNLSLGTYVFELAVTDNFGVSSTDDVTITVRDTDGGLELETMKIFSPNNDGFNDQWVLDPNENLFSECDVIIYDRNGRQVFAARPYQNNWDATLQGNALKEGVYYYVLKCDNKEGDDSGSITVVR